jgi:hypothetical protein
MLIELSDKEIEFIGICMQMAECEYNAVTTDWELSVFERFVKLGDELEKKRIAAKGLINN